MMMDFQKHPPHPIYHSHPSSVLGASHDPRIVAPPPPRAYAPQPPTSARVYYDAYNRRENEMPRAVPAYHYPTATAPSIPPSSVSYAHESISASDRTDNNGYHISQPHPGSMKKHTLDGGLKESYNHHNYSLNINQLSSYDRRMVYREGRKSSLFVSFLFFFFLLHGFLLNFFSPFHARFIVSLPCSQTGEAGA
ncbi:hypothetical protein BDV23DRAFT_148791 [Aspergillus alliaceus]|uniref:Uncharacterized protein n=1 Tax=Petromyces alliaceus TaxID=209559 RepID=A0A5N7CIK8_PETAA|nr:hypothetical protein BDV23DRAFT_148791 [Aspergillus alliaceus]